ncbi:MAG: D-cysteine desulfhydrase family protein [Bacteroidales bacterium]
MITEKFSRLHKLELAPLCTPVEKMERLSASIKGAPSLFIKRDDFIGQLVWGNKLRKLEYTFARAIEVGADTVITCGGVQSNHARTTAQIAKRLGLECVLVLNGDKPANSNGNYRVVDLMKTKVIFIKGREERAAAMNEVAENTRRSGRHPFIIPLGASDVTGVPGFAAAMGELEEQMKTMSTFFTHIYHSTSSGGTQAGLEAGKRIYARDIVIRGISADDPADAIAVKVSSLVNDFFTSLDEGIRIGPEDVNVFDEYTGPGYGIPSAMSERAASLFLEHEGILLDDTYTAKAAAALIDHCERGYFRETDKVLFWHTGGIIAKL